MKPLLAITMGDPAGIGPEIVLKALAAEATRACCRPIVVGHVPSLLRDLDLLALNLRVNTIRDVGDVDPSDDVVNVIPAEGADDVTVPRGVVSSEGGAIAVACIRTAASLAHSGRVDAVVTAPINKAAMHAAGYLYPGHTELLAEIADVDDFSLVLNHGDLHVFHVTTHTSLVEACKAIDQEAVFSTIRLAHRFALATGRESATIAVLGLNPHASEGGLFGHEDLAEIEPAVAAARQIGIDAIGPLPGDAAMPEALHGRYDFVIAMYHDQGHIPFKAVHRDRGVNITVGLPWLRTSVDHGTAFDIAGQGVAREESLITAMEVAADLGPKWPNIALSSQ